MDRIRNIAPVFIFIAVLAFLSVGFALYKAVTAFSGTTESPGYESQPPGTVVSSVPFTILRSKDANTSVSESFPHLADTTLDVIYSKTPSIASAAAAGTITSQDLEEAGMTASSADQKAREVRAERPRGQYTANRPLLSNSSSRVNTDSVTINMPFDYVLNGAVSGNGYVVLTWRVSPASARLDDVSVSLGS